MLQPVFKKFNIFSSNNHWKKVWQKDLSCKLFLLHSSSVNLAHLVIVIDVLSNLYNLIVSLWTQHYLQRKWGNNQTCSPTPILFSESVCLDQKYNLFWVLAWHCMPFFVAMKQKQRQISYYILWRTTECNGLWRKKRCRAGTCFYVVCWLDFEIADVYGLGLKSGLNVWRSPIYFMSPERRLSFLPDDGILTFWRFIHFKNPHRFWVG